MRKVVPRAGLRARRRRAAVRLGDGGDDREAEPDAAARARARGVGAVEALEHARDVLVAQPGPRVGDLDHGASPFALDDA